MACPQLDERLVCGQHALHQNFDLAAGFFAAGKPRLDYARIVEHHDIAGRHQRRDFAELPILDRSRSSVQMQQAARRTLRRRKLRDQFAR
ncbi:hypothetical protein D3C83_62610 [compost metagenome]